jgi:CDP-glycerol glycerophosphotransferase (TagB/SpsB family)
MNITRLIRFFFDSLSFIIGNLVPINKNLVLLHGSTLSSYNESTRYLYEYLLVNSDLSVVWMTDSKVVLEYLKSLDRPCVMHRSVNGFWHYVRAGVVIGNGTSYPTLLKFTGLSSIKICLHHGMGPRSTNSADEKRIKNSFKILKNYSKFDYFNFTSKHTGATVGRLQFLIPKSKRIIFGLPRCDHLFNKNYVINANQEKPLLKSLNYQLKKNTKCILYSPTWRPRSNPLSFPLSSLSGFDLINFDNWLDKSDILLLISVHPLMDDFEDFSNCTNICYLTNNPIIDINQIMPEIDLLITDYSSIATDYMLLNRPVIYVMPDYLYYLYDFGLLEDIRENLPGLEAESLIELQTYILRSLENPQQMNNARVKYLNKYYDVNNTNSCENITKFIESLV